MQNDQRICAHLFAKIQLHFYYILDTCSFASARVGDSFSCFHSLVDPRFDPFVRPSYSSNKSSDSLKEEGTVPLEQRPITNVRLGMTTEDVDIAE